MRRAAIVVVAACGSTTAPVTPAPPVKPVAPVVVAPPPKPAPACPGQVTGAIKDRVDAQGSRLELVPVENWFTYAIAWAGEDLLVLRRVGELGYGDRHQAALERWSVGDATAPVQRHMLATDARTLAVTPDAKRFAIGAGNALEIRDLATAALVTKITVGAPATQIAFAGSDVVVSTGKRITVHDAAGVERTAVTLDGTTPTIMRVYGRDPDHPTHHDNILKSSPSWTTAIALSKAHVAVGGSDSKVRLVERATQKQRTLEHKWKYTEHRHMGGNPDLNTPLAMRFSDDGKQLVVAYRHGEVLTWNTATGALAKTLDGACTLEEGTRLVNRYGGPARVPTAEDLRGCAPTEAVISPDGKLHASNIGMIRVRALPGGAPVTMFDAEVSGMLAFSPGGTLAVADIYGMVRLWNTRGNEHVFLPKPTSTGPLTPLLSTTGTLLAFEYGTGLVAWDLTTGKNLAGALPATERLVAVSEAGNRFVVTTASGLELRDAVDRPGAKLALPDGKLTFSAAGRHILDVVGHGDYVVRDLDRGTDVKIQVASTKPVLRDDGRRLATFGPSSPLQIWDTASGAAVATHETGVRNAAFFHDGKRIAVVVQTKREAMVKIIAIGGKVLDEFALTGWINDLAVTPDDGEVVIAYESKALRYTVATKARHEVDVIGSPNRIHFAADANTLAFENYGFVELRRNDDDFSPLGRVHALTTGGFLVEGAARAVTGTADAHAAIVTRVKSTTGDLAVLAGTASWDRWVRPDVYECMLAGVVVSPPN